MVRSLVNLVDWLGDEFEFLVATRDREPGDAAPFPGVHSEVWQTVGKAKVFYRRPRCVELRFWRAFLRSTPHDVLYLNTCFAASIVQILLLRRLGRVPPRPTIVAPRGVLEPGALGLKRSKKRLYLILAQRLELHQGVIWHATGKDEERNILGWFPGRCGSGPFADPLRQGWRPSSPVVVAANLPPRGLFYPAGTLRPPKAPGEARIVFLSRIDRKKNLDVAIELLAGVKGRVWFDIWGPISDARYWRKCQGLVARLPSAVRTTYHGAVAPGDVGEVFSKCHLLFLPTRGENFGHVILEALCAGCPVLVSDQTPWRHLEEKGVGWDLPLTDLRGFRAVLDAVVGMKNEEFQLHAQKAREFGWAIASDPTALEATRTLLWWPGWVPKEVTACE